MTATPLPDAPSSLPPADGDAPARLQLRGITKRYPGIVANDGIDLRVGRGQIHAILGENGAGKSTLMKIIYGAVAPDAGEVLFDGRPVHIRNPQQARQLGIAMVFQHFNLFETLTVAENIWLGQEWTMSREMLRVNLDEAGKLFGLDIDLERPVHTLSVGERQKVEILRSLVTHPKLLILDEPTSVLTPQAVQSLFAMLRRLAQSGCSILYISHKLHEIRSLCDRCTVIRQGKVTGVVDPREHSDASLARLMIGAEPPALQNRPGTPGELVLQVEGLSLPCDNLFGTALDRLHLQVRAGEVVGIAGISGNGQNELLRALSGEDTRAAPDAVRLFGQPAGRSDPRQRRRQWGLHFVPEERLGRATVPSMDLAQNLLLTRDLAIGRLGWLSRRRLHAKAAEVVQRFRVKAAGTHSAARSLSGGNLQKYIVGREMDAGPRLLILAQPTWGVDVGAASQIRAQILALREQGCAVLVISEELDELFEVCDRLYVMAKGTLSPSLQRAEASIEKIGLWMSGLWEGGPQQPTAAGQAELATMV
ncbi:ABC transporter ATP-binding protein [Corticibacter populi]|uniref:ABC transporter ATP-binding protein n=1 Tax=Corticibacter populi TaxID=1550736 RepID=A0A3M6QYY3_9BURK|nr:ABC transporter ATP-binding protein [Corticibacter populi]RMX08103.1 ABC transporter ATP-binding protein [Corticibacter populi]RZS35352.1 nucleoside ABC transporter ATP-binding protein [Corticibacter populi]